MLSEQKLLANSISYLPCAMCRAVLLPRTCNECVTSVMAHVV
jgi:hypothetical protein